ncbi:MAG TPA: hypothetical protein VID19_00060 [Candidatus Eremiobacteraceae bacterium]|jgi:hypothetical protein
MRIEDAVIDVVVEMADLLFGVFSQRIGDVEIFASDEYLHSRCLPVTGLDEFRLAKMGSCPDNPACAVRCVSNQARAAPSAITMMRITTRATKYGVCDLVFMI